MAEELPAEPEFERSEPDFDGFEELFVPSLSPEQPVTTIEHPRLNKTTTNQAAELTATARAARDIPGEEAPDES